VTRVAVVAATIAALLLAACGGGGTTEGSSAGRSPRPTPAGSTPTTPPRSTSATATAFRISSPAFAAGGQIPARYSCFAANQSPPLDWGGAPSGTAQLALVLDDPDAVGGRYVHWVLVGIRAGSAGSPAGRAPAGATVLPNSSGDAGYLGPCPPSGTGVHHYRFTLYALGARLELEPGTPATTAEAAIKRAAVAQTRLVGLYER
jgi:Raf kinase inhibitor-like YbhB/YbcL family protein